MGNDRRYRGLERVKTMFERLGGDRRDSVGEPEPAHERETGGSDLEARATGTDRDSTAEAARPLTDGGADDASAGGGPWIEDDPIAFDDEESDHGTALLEAVTDADEESPSLGTGTPSTSDAAGTDAPNRGQDDVDPERLDDLEARIEALESDHVELEAGIDDVAAGLSDLRGDVETVGTDVRQLVALLGGIALATDAAAHGDRVDEPAAAGEASDGAIDEREDPPDDRSAGETGQPQSTATPPGDESPIVDPEAHDASDSDASDPERSPSDGNVSVPDGIHRDVGDSPDTASDSNPEVASSDPNSDGASSDATRADEPARELVDPRTDAVGARLRQYREGFADDPTEDLPTGNAADEFRFEKILLPTDGEAAPDLSADELEKPYLASLPDGYAADAVVLEWLDWLVSAADGETAAQAIAYYESIEWVTGDVHEDLLGYLDGLDASGDADPIGEPPEALDLQDHLRSLQYVTELASGEVGTDGV